MEIARFECIGAAPDWPIIRVHRLNGAKVGEQGPVSREENIPGVNVAKHQSVLEQILVELKNQERCVTNHLVTPLVGVGNECKPVVLEDKRIVRQRIPGDSRADDRSFPHRPLDAGAGQNVPEVIDALAANPPEYTLSPEENPASGISVRFGKELYLLSPEFGLGRHGDKPVLIEWWVRFSRLM
jgi:hypothetical protein